MEISQKNSDVPSITLNYYNSTTALIENEGKSIRVSTTEEVKIVYDPYANRDLEHPNTFFGAFLHLVKTSLGTGILAIPRAFKNAGLLVGLAGTILVGVICTHSIHILVKASQKVCRKTNTPSLGFADTAEGVFKLGPRPLRGWSTFAKYFVEGGLTLVHFLAGCVYLVFISITLNKLFSAYFPEVETWKDYTFKLMLLPLLLICGQVRELKHLVPFSFVANVMLLTSFAITAYYMFTGIADVDIKDRSLATSLSGVPSFFSTVLFSMEGIGTIMPIENSMLTPQFIGWAGVLNLGMTVIILMYATIGFLGYYRFGDDIQPIITGNLPDKAVPAQVAQGAIATAVFFSFMLLFYVPMDIVWTHLKHKIPNSRWNISQIALRCSAIILATGIAIAGGDKLGLLIDLIGAILLSTLGLFVPAFLDILVDWNDGWGVFHWRLIKDILIMIIAVFGLVSGVYYAILADL